MAIDVRSGTLEYFVVPNDLFKTFEEVLKVPVELVDNNMLRLRHKQMAFVDLGSVILKIISVLYISVL